MKKPFFSIIIPVGPKADLKRFNECLKSLRNQTYSYFELIVVRHLNSPYLPNPHHLKSHVSHLISHSGKSVSRNLGASKAKGKYLVHIDHDYTLDKTTLAKAKKEIDKSDAKAVVINETTDDTTIWQRARKLERQITLNDTALITPQIVETKLFGQIGGFDTETDALDDWTLYLKLKKQGVRFSSLPQLANVYERTGIVESFVNKFKKGRYLKKLQEKYDPLPQMSLTKRFKVYLDNRKLLTKNPLVSISLLSLKLADWLGFYFGSLFPISQKDMSQIYKAKKVAANFDREQQSLYGKLKNYWELKSLFTLLPTTHHSQPTTILDLGAGTGRITRELINRGYQVTAADPSSTMLNVLKSEPPNLPNYPYLKIVHLISSKLPFVNNSFDYVICLRVIWHIKNADERNRLFSEAVRVAKKGILVDFAMTNKLLNKLNSNDYYFTKKEISELAKKNNLKIADVKYLPLSRLLIRFEKPKNLTFPK